jgi:hypothetical protein
MEHEIKHLIPFDNDDGDDDVNQNDHPSDFS